MADAPNGREALRLADVFAKRSRLRIKQLFSEIHTNADDSTYKLAQEVLKGNYAWLEDGAITTLHGDTGAPPSPGAGSAGTPDKRGSLSGERVATQVGAGA